MTKHQIDLYEQYHLTSDIEVKFSLARKIIDSQLQNPVFEYWKNNSLESMDGELWKPLSIPLMASFYNVSNYGRVKRLFRTVGYRNGTPKKWKERIMPFSSSGNGRIRLTLYVNNEKQTIKPHQLVMGAFSNNPNNLPHINHIDGNPKNNHILNLEYCDASYNELHSYHVLGKKSYSAGKKLHLSLNSKGEIGQYTLDGVLVRTFSCIAETKNYGFLHTHVGRVVAGERKTHANFIWKSLNKKNG